MAGVWILFTPNFSGNRGLDFNYIEFRGFCRKKACRFSRKKENDETKPVSNLQIDPSRPFQRSYFRENFEIGGKVPETKLKKKLSQIVDLVETFPTVI